MNAEIKSRIIGLSRDDGDNEYHLVISQRFADSTFGIIFSMFISESTAIRLAAALHLDEVDKLNGQKLHCTIDDETHFSVIFDLCGCFPSSALTSALPSEVVISGIIPEKASGITVLSMYCPAAPNGYPFFQDYFLSEKSFSYLLNAFDTDNSGEIKDHEVSIKEVGRCYLKLSLTALEITAETKFYDDRA